MENLYLWAENLEGYFSDNVPDSEGSSIEIKRLNFFIGKNNSGKSRFLRTLFNSRYSLKDNNCSKSKITKIIKCLQNNVFDPNFDKITYDGEEIDGDWSFDEGSVVLCGIDKLLDKFEEIKPYPMFVFLEDCKKVFDELIHYKVEEFMPPYPLNPEEMCFEVGEYTVEFWELPENQKKELEKDYLYQCKMIDYEYSSLNWKESAEKSKNWDMFLSELSECFKEENITKYYIPVLRGMRPVSGNHFPYRKRTEKDYFGNENHEKNVITGESLFQELTEHLLGEPEQRQLIADYQKLLSQYFFDNQEITLIPKYGTDVVHIKIGNEAQFPIHQLGDGLQQAIILTYPVFLNNQDTHMFFIEEPELHMHTGMVRQLMSFYLNETKHYYFFTTHSNHLLDMADESDEVIIQKFVKQTDEQQKTSFQIYRCGRDRDLLASLGVKPSSVYLANCTIWVEGITDRLYLLKYMEKYLQVLQNNQPEQYLRYRRFMPNYHYAFVEYSGGNIVHWDFSDDFADGLADKGLSAKAIASDMLLIADGDNREKAERLFEWNEELGTRNVVVLQSKEIENTLPFDVIVDVAKARFERMKSETKTGFEIGKLDVLNERDYFVHETEGIGLLLDKQIRLPETDETKAVFSDSGVGTIKDKLKFCREVIQYFDNNPDWELTAEARELCEKIFAHIERCNAH